MKKIMLVMLMGVLMVSGCSQNNKKTTDKTSSQKEEKQEVETFNPKNTGFNCGYIKYKYKNVKHEPVTVKAPTGNKAYLKDYVGKNLSTVGYYSLGGDFRDEYGKINIELKLVDVNGNYINPEKEEELKKYYIVGQDAKPNTEIVKRKVSDISERLSLEKVTIYCEKMNEYDGREVDVKQAKTSPNITTYPIRNYVGDNLYDAGYHSLGGDYLDEYGQGTLKLVINSTDGKNIDISKKGQLQKYQVVKQDVQFNTMLKYSVDSKNKSIVNTQNVEGIVLTVSPLKKEK